jgi:biopolymer transport protein ExbD
MPLLLENKQAEYSAMSEINVTPLVDVMLVLLVVFMVTAPFMMQAMNVNLPKTAPVAKLPEVKAVEITIDATGHVFVDRGEVVGLDLEAKLKSLVEQGKTVNVQLRADETVPYGRVAEVMAAVNRAGVAKLSFVTALQGRNDKK